MQLDLIKEANAYLNYHSEKYLAEAAKDDMRINDIITKAKGDKNKENQLAKNMADKITSLEKVEARYNAAVDILGIDSDIAQIFAKKAKELGSKIEPAKKVKFGSQFESSWRKVREEDTENRFKKGDIFNKGFGSENYSVGFEDPWAAYFYDDYCGQISDGYWENSPKFEKNQYWRKFSDITAIYGDAQYTKGNIYSLLYNGLANANLVAEYANVNLDSFAKCYALKNHKINKMIDIDPNAIKSEEDIDLLAEKLKIDKIYIEAWLYEPGVSNPEKALKSAYSNIMAGLRKAMNEKV